MSLKLRTTHALVVGVQHVGFDDDDDDDDDINNNTYHQDHLDPLHTLLQFSKADLQCNDPATPHMGQQQNPLSLL